MGKPRCDEAEFCRLFEAFGPTLTAKKLEMDVRQVFNRRRRIEQRSGVKLTAPMAESDRDWSPIYESRVPVKVFDGRVVIGSDPHYWPGRVPVAHRAMIKLMGELNPKVVIMNGDVFDLPRISRFSATSFRGLPKVREELEAVDERLDEIIGSSKRAQHLWCLGNHDHRYEKRLTESAGEFDGVPGFALKDHFPRWTLATSIWINNDVVIKHRFKGGLQAALNNTLWAGKSMVTGHLHRLDVAPLSDYNGTRYGVNCGTLEDPYGPQFEYGEDNPVNHRSGFVVLTFHKGRLLFPEIVIVRNGESVDFRGKVIEL